MPSTFSWLDFSDGDRQRALDLVDSLREEGTQDELGLGSIRDALADRLFPGTSTIQTRVRYFLLLPWILRELRPADATEERFERWLRRRQDGLRASLERGGETLGVIGRRAREEIQRLPSSVYWAGLQRWGILAFDGSESGYARVVARRGSSTESPRDEAGNPIDDGRTALWDPRLPDPPDGWKSETGFRLTRKEADYLIGTITFAAHDSLLAHLVTTETEPGEAEFAWECPSLGRLPSALASDLDHARNFSETLHGAALLYNLMLAEEKRSADLKRDYQEALDSWEHRISARASALAMWGRNAFFESLAGWGARVRLSTRRFVADWLDLALPQGRKGSVASSDAARSLVRGREAACKPGRARLGSRRALAEWNGGAGDAPMDYRWRRPVRGILRDLREAGREKR